MPSLFKHPFIITLLNILISFNANADISFTMSVSEGCYPLEVIFTNTSTQGDTYSWDFGDGTYHSGEHAEHTYSEPGLYLVTFSAYNQWGLIWYAEDYVTVWGNLGVFEMTKENICPNEPVSFNHGMDTAIVHWDFGDGNFSTDHKPVHYYQDTGWHYVTLTSFTPCDTAEVIDSIYIRSDVPLWGKVNLVLTDYTICPGDRVSGDAFVDDYITDYYWNLGDGSTSTGQYFDKKYFEKGEYELTLTVANGCGIDTSVNKILEVKDNLPISGDFFMYINPDTKCAGDIVQLNCQNQWSETGNIQSYYWDFGDGTTTTTDYFRENHVYYEPGVYNYSVVVTNLCNSDSALYGMLEITENYTGSEEYYIYHYYDHICPGNPVSFYLSGDHPELLHEINWNFGDGNLLEGSYYTKHTYSSPGQYIISANFRNGCGEEFYVNKTIIVEENVNPPINIEVHTYVEESCVGETIGFGLSPFTDLNLKKAIWNFGDYHTEVSYQTYTYHTYDSPGEYDYSINIESYCGYDTTLSGTVIVKDEIIEFEPVWLDIIPAKACPEEKIHFDINPGNVFPDEITYDFGDGSIESGEGSVYHTYSSPGNYYVQATYTDFCGNHREISRNIEISNNVTPDLVDYNIKDYHEACSGDTILFKVINTGAEYTIGFGDGQFAAMEDTVRINNILYNTAKYAYSGTGIYIGAIHITNTCGNTASKKITMVINDNVIYDPYKYHDFITIGKGSFFRNGYATGEEINFYSTYGVKMEWDFGDGTPIQTTNHAGLPTMTHSYVNPGIYILEVKVTTSCGRSSIFFREINVMEGNVGLDESLAQDDNLISVFPNPSTKEISIRFYTNEAKTVIRLSSINGQVVYRNYLERTTTGQNKRINISHLPPGLYILQATTSNNNWTEKVVIL